MQAAAGRRDWLLILGFWTAVAAALIIRTMLQADTAPLLGDSDDAMRMVTATDLLDGQSWQDLNQHRDNAPFGAAMHWSRLVDAPIALLLAVTRPVFGTAAPNLVAVVWPLLLMLPLLILAVVLIRRLVPAAGTITALALPIVSFVVLIEFLPGRVDHHNVQILLTLTMAFALVTLRDRLAGGVVAGLAMATSLAIGLETLPMLVAAAAIHACLWLAEPQRYRIALTSLGATFALGTLGHFVLAIAPADYATPACDMLSIAYVTPALLGGLGLVATAGTASGLPRPWQRFLALAAAGAVTVGATAALFPHCLGGPYAAAELALPGLFDPIAEAQPIWVRIFTDPPTAAGFALTVLLALPVTAWLAWRERGDAQVDWLIVFALLVPAALIMMLQMRGARLAAPFALPAAAWVISQARLYYLGNPRPGRSAVLVGAWLAFAGVAHYGIAGLLTGWLAAPPAGAAQTTPEPPWQVCFMERHYDRLASLPAGIVIAPAWNGSHILRYTPHAVVAAGFHRNIDGIRAADAFFSGSEEEARQVAEERGVDYVAVCPANRKHASNVGPAEGQHWNWLEPLSAPNETLQVYRVRR